MIPNTAVSLSLHDIAGQVGHTSMFSNSVSYVAAGLADVAELTFSARKFINDTRSHFKRCNVLNTKKVRHPSAWLKINDNIFVRNKFPTNVSCFS